MKNKINVNISPNPLDLQTLHCSQNDTSERKFYFTLHNNGEVIDTGEISDPIFEPFSVYKGGTEQLLPVNTDDPTTSPIIADIQYPDEEKTEQEFTYRESPTTIDGNAVIERIKGNTLVWNQLVQNGNFADTSGWTGYRGTISVANNVLTFTSNSDGGNNAILKTGMNFVANHTYLIIVTVNANGNTIKVRPRDPFGTSESLWRTTSGKATFGWTQTLTQTGTQINIQLESLASGSSVMYENIMCIDLTQLADSRITDYSSFTQYFPLPYYPYDSGSLLSFNGSGIKTVGFNQWDEEWEQGTISTSTGQNSSSTSRIRSKNYISVIPTETYYCKAPYNVYVFFYDAEYNFLGYSSSNKKDTTFTIVYSNAMYIRFRLDNSGADYGNDVCINISNPSKNGTYEPYTTHTTDLPISTYFPTGMKSAGTVYDELTPTRAIIRVGSFTFNGTEDWVMETQGDGAKNFYIRSTSTRPDNAKKGTFNGIVASKDFHWRTSASDLTNIVYSGQSSGLVQVRVASDFISDIDANKWKTYLTSNPITIHFELATEEETQFTHASLICEDGESTLYQDVDSLVCDCTEDFSKDSGFKDCKIKFTNDDGVVYSNKIQLHIERKP